MFDIVYALLEIRVWYQNDQYQPIWQTIYPMHIFGTGTFLVELLLKIIVFVLLFKAKGLLGKWKNFLKKNWIRGKIKILH